MISAMSDIITLNNGVSIPGYGFGCYKIWEKEPCVQAVSCALECGYRYIDTAAFYKNEAAVGYALQKSGLSREDVFLLSKVWPSFFERPLEALYESLRLLRQDYLDGYLLHWPGTSPQQRLNAFEALLREQEQGRIRVLGVSNFLEPHLEELHAAFGFWPAINQIEVHPSFSQDGLCRYCADRGIQVIAWAPMGRGTALEHPVVVQLAETLGKTPAQTILRWHVEQGRIPIPKSVNRERILENAGVFDFCLSDDQRRLLDRCNLPDKQGKTSKDPVTFAG